MTGRVSSESLAGYHRNIDLPPCSPNLNIIERLRKFFKKKKTYNEYYEKVSVFKKESMGFFQNIEKFKSELQTLMTDNFELIGV